MCVTTSSRCASTSARCTPSSPRTPVSRRGWLAGRRELAALRALPPESGPPGLGPPAGGLPLGLPAGGPRAAAAGRELRRGAVPGAAEARVPLPLLGPRGPRAGPRAEAAAAAPARRRRRGEPGEGRSAKKVQAAAANLQRTLGTVVSGMMAGDTGGTEADAWAEAWEILLRRAVSGPGAEQGAADDPYAGVEQAHRESAAASVEGFMNEVEGWSMELQRHSPEAWNETSVLLVRCITWLPGAAPSPPKFAL
ncbi:unnamed protein product [Prorocentrum cordatum]|uniref:Uncharacterized protein n=1 Tax=Prorocentrum cordatum TaxID=2364126 RepID=A0ABN9Q237_9DINO|nr:unnamed protein product [Polarella glacialis]